MARHPLGFVGAAIRSGSANRPSGDSAVPEKQWRSGAQPYCVATVVQPYRTAGAQELMCFSCCCCSCR